MNTGRKALGWVFVIVAVVALLLLLYFDVDASEIGGQWDFDCYPGEYCFEWYEPWYSDVHCNGGLYTLWFCYLLEDIHDASYWHFHETCTSSIIPPVIFRIMLPLSYGAPTMDPGEIQ